MNIKNLSERNKGIFFIILAAVFFSLMTVFVRLSGDLPSMQKAFFRNLVAAFVAFILLKKSGEKIVVGKSNMRDLILRSSFGTGGIICNFLAIDHLTIADANLLNKLSPFFAILMSILILKEKAHRMEWISVCIAFSGALLVIKPGTSLANVYSLVGLFGGFCAGVAYTYVRKLGTNGVKGPVIVLCFSSFSTLVLLPPFILQYTPMSGAQILLLLGAGLSAAGGQLSITAAYKHAPAKEISVYDYTQVVFAALWGYILFAEIPDILSILGYIIILAASIVKFMYGRRKE